MDGMGEMDGWMDGWMGWMSGWRRGGYIGCVNFSRFHCTAPHFNPAEPSYSYSHSLLLLLSLTLTLTLFSVCAPVLLCSFTSLILIS